MPALCRRCTGVTPLPIFAGPVGQCTTLVPVPRMSAMSSGSSAHACTSTTSGPSMPTRSANSAWPTPYLARIQSRSRTVMA